MQRDPDDGSKVQGEAGVWAYFLELSVTVFVAVSVSASVSASASIFIV